MEKKNDLHGRFDEMVSAVLDPPPEKRKGRKPLRSVQEREAQRLEERRRIRNGKRKQDEGR